MVGDYCRGCRWYGLCPGDPHASDEDPCFERNQVYEDEEEPCRPATL